MQLNTQGTGNGNGTGTGMGMLTSSYHLTLVHLYI